MSTSTDTWPARRAVLARRVRLLVGAVVAYNVIEAAVAIVAGTVASSIALVGFGLDSVVEVVSALAITWQFAAADHDRREKPALRVVAVSFFLLAAYVSTQALLTLSTSADVEHSSVGIALAAVSLVVMPTVSWAERRAGRELGSASVVADSKQTLLCSYLSAVLLVGLVLNSTLGWGWADPLAALVIAGLAVKEGREAWRGDACCTPASALLSGGDAGVPGVDGGCRTGACACCASVRSADAGRP